MERHIYNIPASCPFTDTLALRVSAGAKGNPAALSRILFLLPNRRACQSLKEAFVRLSGETPAVLPQMIPIADLAEDEVIFSALNTETFLENLPPEISNLERMFLLAKLIFARPKEYGLVEMTFAQALSLAQELAKLMDSVYNEQLNFDKLEEIVPAQYATHWQDTLHFLKIITHWWPQILKEKGVVDSIYRRNELLKAQAEIWRKNPPAEKVVAAGVNAAFPGLQNLLKVIAESPNGEVYFCGLDKYLDATSWEQIDENHPQYNHKRLLEALGAERDDVKNILAAENEPRENMVSEIMRPACETVYWQNLKDNPLDERAWQGLHILNCFDSQQEALSIAVLMRQTLETPQKTAALVTPDRNLARRVAAALKRWNIKIDDSAGLPLHLTPVGIYFGLIVAWLEQPFSNVQMLALLKNPFVRLGCSAAEIRRKVRAYEHQKREPKFNIQDINQADETPEFLQILEEKSAPMQKLFQQKEAPFKELLINHIALAEALAESDDRSGAENLWRAEDGRSAAALMSDILEKADVLGNIETEQYGAVLKTLMAGQTVRPLYGTHPRLKILGPIEARFNRFDTVIIGGLNEGVWPTATAADPWMSRPMKKDFGLPLPEVNIGVLADDFAHLLCAPEVYLTRAQKAEGSPADKSRWMLRLETVLKAYGLPEGALEDSPCLSQALYLDTPKERQIIKAPAPCPDVEKRPRVLSASAVEKLMRDPYEIYAEKILKLKPLNEIDEELSMKEYGSFVHKVLEVFCRKYPTEFPANAEQELMKIGQNLLEEMKVEPEIKAFWAPKFEKTVRWVVGEEKTYRQDVAKVYPEVQGAFSFEAPAGTFTITARADRLDVLKDGSINVIDYKTGEIRKPKEIKLGYAPQLPIEGLIAREGGFKNKEESIKKANVNELIYWRLGEEKSQTAADDEDLLDKTLERLKELVEKFDDKQTPYYARPNPKHVLKYTNYEHLARVKEWQSGENDE